jgi:hypothetical protein
VTLVIAPDGSPVEAPQPRGRRRARITKAQAPEAMLQAAYAGIAEAKPPKLREIAAFAESARDFAKLRGDQADAAVYEAIRACAQRRLAWFQRLPQN